MCEGCRKIEEKIAHYREIASYVMDRPTLDSIDVLVAQPITSSKAGGLIGNRQRRF